jgi:hypothetical protein
VVGAYAANAVLLRTDASGSVAAALLIVVATGTIVLMVQIWSSFRLNACRRALSTEPWRPVTAELVSFSIAGVLVGRGVALQWPADTEPMGRDVGDGHDDQVESKGEQANDEQEMALRLIVPRRLARHFVPDPDSVVDGRTTLWIAGKNPNRFAVSLEGGATPAVAKQSLNPITMSALHAKVTA